MREMTPTETARTIMFVIPVSRLTGTTEDQRRTLVENLTSRAQVKLWGLILHDRDDATATAPHWQGVLHTTKALPASRFRQWLPGCEPVQKVSGGHRGLLDTMGYLTHENEPPEAHKHVYDAEEVSATPGWDWYGEWTEVLNCRLERERRSLDRSRPSRSAVLAAVRDGSMSAEDGFHHGVSNMRQLRQLRAAALRDIRPADLPPVRVNFYVQVPDTVHPSMQNLVEALARTLADDGRFFRIRTHGRFGDGKEADDYDGESVLLMTADDLDLWGAHFSLGFEESGPMGTLTDVFTMLSARPEPCRITTTHGQTQLIHKHTVIFGTQPFERFRASLEYRYAMVIKDAHGQAAASLPIVVPVDASGFTVNVSSRFATGRGELDGYVTSERYRLVLADAVKAARALPESDRAEAVAEIEARQTAPIVTAGDSVAERMADEDSITKEEYLARFSDISQPISEFFAPTRDSQ